MARPSRSTGEGSVYFDKSDRRWHGWIDVGAPGERRRRRHVTGRSRAEVVKALRETASKRDAGVVPSEGRAPKLSEWADYYLSTVATRKVRPTTLASYRWLFEQHILPVIGTIRIDRLQPEDIERVHTAMYAKGLAPATVLHAHRVLSRALKVAWQRGRVSRNVAQMIDAPSLVRDEIEPLTADEARLLLATAAGRRNEARWSVALALGLRQGEALGLRWQDINVDAGTLAVRKALQRRIAQHGCGGTCGRKRGADCPQQIPGGLFLVEPKSRAGRRTIVVPQQLVESLRRQRLAQAHERDIAGSEWVDLDLVFARPDGRPIDPKDDFQEWKRLLKEAGVRDARLHDARHTAATIMLTMGVPARAVMQILGHSQVQLTLGTYSHVVPELATEAARRISEALWESPDDPA